MMESRFRELRPRLKHLLALFRLGETKLLFAFSIMVGISAGVAAFLFSWLIHFFTSLFFENAETLSFLGRFYFLIIPAVGGFLVGVFVHFVDPEAKGDGVSEAIRAIATEEGRIKPLVAVTKSITSSLCIGSGGSAGKEGPIVQIGSAIGSTIGQAFKMPGDLTKMLAACGAAGGLSAIFGAPLGGVMFSLEVLLNDFAARAFSMVVISSVTAAAVSKHLLGEGFFFRVPPYALRSTTELFFYFLLGILAACMAKIFIVLLSWVEEFFEEYDIPEYLKPALGGLLVGCLGVFFPQVFGIGHDAIESALHDALAPGLLLLLAFSKILATSLTLGSGGSGGTLIPSLFIGAMLGGTFGHAVNALFPETVAGPGAYALVGMGALFASTVRAPITAILIVFEITGDYQIILPVMTASIVGTLASYTLIPDTLYTIKLKKRGIDLSARDERRAPQNIRAREVMTEGCETVSEEMTDTELFEKLEVSRHSGFPVVNQEGKLTGLITHYELSKALALHQENGTSIVVGEVMRKDPPVVYPDDSLVEVFSKMKIHDIDRLPVVEKNDPQKIVGIITRSDVLHASFRRS